MKEKVKNCCSWIRAPEDCRFWQGILTPQVEGFYREYTGKEKL